MIRVARGITSRWGAVVIALLGLAIGLGISLGWGEAERESSPLDGLPIGSDSAAAAELRERLPDEDASAAVVLFSRDDALTPADLAAAQRKSAQLLAEAGAAPQGPPLIPSEDGTAAITVVPVQTSDATEAATIVDELRATAKDGLPDGLTAQVTGPAAVQADLAAVFEGADLRLLMATAGIVAVLLVITYRSPILWVLPLTVVGVADRLAAVVATRVLEAANVVWDESTIGILSVLVFGAGTDYALLLISRYRDELRRHESRREAMARALSATVEPVFASAATVVLGLLTLLLSAFPATRGLGLACAVGVVIAATFALIVLPAVLACFGRWVFWPRIPRVGQAVLTDSRSLWRRVGDAVMARPVVFALLTTALLLGAGAGASQIRTGLEQADQFLDKPEAIAGAERLAESFPSGSADPVQVLTTADPQQVQTAVTAVDGVDSATVAAQADGVTEISAVLGTRTTADSRSTIAEIRRSVAELPQTHVGGSVAAGLDESEATTSDRLLIFPIILALVLAALILLLRSLVAPILLVLTVVLTYVASLGISWLLFTQVFGFERLDDGAPLLAFVFLVALGVDYNIFLVTRAKEEAAEHGSRRAMLRALAATGGVITSAGILLAAVFAVLGVLPLVVLAQLGIIICVGVLLDTLVVRTVLVPALAFILGDRFWWPRRLGNAT